MQWPLLSWLLCVGAALPRLRLCVGHRRKGRYFTLPSAFVENLILNMYPPAHCVSLTDTTVFGSVCYLRRLARPDVVEPAVAPLSVLDESHLQEFCWNIGWVSSFGHLPTKEKAPSTASSKLSFESKLLS